MDYCHCESRSDSAISPPISTPLLLKILYKESAPLGVAIAAFRGAFSIPSLSVTLTLLPMLLLKITYLIFSCVQVDVGCHAIHGFSEETGDYAILGIVGIKYITYRQAHPALSQSCLSLFPLAFPLLTLCKACTSPYSVPFFVSYCLTQQILQQGWQLLQLHLVISLLRQAFGIDQAIRY